MGATAAYGAQLQMGDGGSPEDFTTIADVKDISGPAISRDLVETTSHYSTDGWEEHVPTIKRSGEVSFELNWDPNDPTHDMATGLGAKVTDDDVTNYRLVYARMGMTWEFAAYVTKFETTAPVAGVHGASVTMKIVGPPELVVSGS